MRDRGTPSWRTKVHFAQVPLQKTGQDRTLADDLNAAEIVKRPDAASRPEEQAPLPVPYAVIHRM
jgi:hypothetical protein